MSDDLKPCPFCGWDAPYVRTTGLETEVYCESCTAVGPLVHSVGPDEDVDEVAIELWNRRALEARIKHLERKREDVWNAAIDAAAAAAEYVLRNIDILKADGETYETPRVQKIARGLVDLARQDILALRKGADHD